MSDPGPTCDPGRMSGPGQADGARAVSRQSQSGGSRGTELRESGAQQVLRLGSHAFEPEQLLVMAIVNRTPDSFYQPGVTWDPAAALERVHVVVAEGADIVDIGGVPADPAMRSR